MEKELTKQAGDLYVRNQDFDNEMEKLSHKIEELFPDTWGHFTQKQVRPHAANLFRQRGVNIQEYTGRTVFKLDEKAYAEVDMLLFNENIIVVLEIKNTLRQRDVEKHLERMEKLSKHHSSILKNKVLNGALAGNMMTPEVENFAISAGLFVIKPMSENVGISNALDFSPKTWKVQ